MLICVAGWTSAQTGGQVFKAPNDYRVTASLLEHLIEGPVRKMRETKGTKRPQDLKPALQRTMWKELLVEKDAEGLARALQFVNEERERLATDLALAEGLDLALAFEHRNLLDVAEAIIGAADMRKESRGSHYRGDYPERDDANWLTNVFSTHKEGKLVQAKKWINEEIGWTDAPGDVRIMPWG